MKNLFYILLTATLLLPSCKKSEVLTPVDEQTETVETEEGILLYGDWVLESGQMFIENMETGEKTVYNHFDSQKSISSLRYSGAEFEFETIEKGVTMWTFIAPPNWEGYGEFWIDNDSIQPYGLYVLDDNWSVVEHPTATGTTMQLGGSSRPLQAVVDSYSENTVTFIVQEAYESINGYNCNYYSELTFKKQ